MNARRSVTVLLITALAALSAWLALGSAPALATLSYGLTGSFGLGVDKTPPGGNVCTVALGEECGHGTVGSGTGQFKEPAGVAVNQSSADVYVVDQGNNRVQKFDASGNPENFSALGTNVLSGTGTETFSLSGFFGGEENSGLDSANGIAVDNSCYYHEPLTATECKTLYPSNGDVYVADTGHNVIDKFNEAGSYIGQLTGIGPPGSITPFAGTPLFGVAVDQEGKVWVYESSNEVVSCNNALVNECSPQWATGYTTSPGFAVDSADNVYALRGNPNVEKFSGAGIDLGAVTECGCGTGLAVDGSNDLYVAEGKKVAEYGAPIEPPSEPLPIHKFGQQRLANASGIAVSAAGAVYVADSADDDVDIFRLGEPPEETPLTEAATPVTPTTALLHGTLRPFAKKVGYRFEYNTGASCEGGITTVPKESKGAVSEEVKGLQPGALYTFCLVAENAYGRLSGSEESLTTPPAVVGVSKCTASGVTGEAATFEASLEPLGAVTEYHFQYGTSLPGFKTKVKISTLSVGVETDSEPVAELEPNRSYECRLLATREIEGKPYTTEGEIGTFKTSALTPAVIDESTSNIGSRSAGLLATIDPENSTTTFYIEYVEATHYCTSCADPYEPGARIPEPPKPEGEVGSDIAYHTVQQTAERLTPNTTYDYRAVATNSPEPGTGTSYGANESFSTAPENPPVAITGVASDVTQAGATVSGTVNPEGYATSYVFELGTASAYGTQISGPAGSETEAEAVSIALQGLAAGTVYHYRFTAINRNGASYGADATFTTPGYSYAAVFTLPPGPLFVPTPAFPPVTTTPTTSKPNLLTKAQKLSKALSACRRKPKRQRASCEKRVRKEYRSKAKAKKSKH